jgi:hypothetical protein
MILGLALLIQWADLHPLRSKVREMVDKRFPSPLLSPRWEEVSREVDSLILIPPFQCGPYTAAGGVDNYVWFGLWASAHRLRSNNYYAARVTKAELQGHCVDIMREQLDGKLDARSAYLVTDAVKAVWGLRGVTSHRCEVVDGYNLCVPGASGPTTVGVPPAPAYELGTTVELKSNDGPGRQYLTLGWGESNPHGTWSEGPVSIIRLGRQGVPRPLVLALDTTAFVARGHPRLDVDIVINGVQVDQWILRSLRPVSVRRARIPADVIARRPSVDIELRFQNPEAPLFINAGPSTQFLGLNVRWLQLFAE